jgi:cytochrome c oxidase cbb3-type subunit 3
MKRLVLAGLAAATAIGASAPLWAQDAHQAATAAPAVAAPAAAAPTQAQTAPPVNRAAAVPGRGIPVPNGYAPFPVDPAMVARGKTLFAAQCASCHAIDIRGTDKGPNLRRSVHVLNDTGNGKLAGLEIRENLGHKDAFANLSDKDAADLTHFMLSFPPMRQGGAEIGIPAKFEVGNATAGRTYFTANCASCHAVAPGVASSSVNIAGIATRITDPKNLQQAWLSPRTTLATTAKVTLKDGSIVEGPATSATEFAVTVTAGGAARVIQRKDASKVEMTYPLAGHSRLLRTITDTNIHDVTGYLVTLK